MRHGRISSRALTLSVGLPLKSSKKNGQNRNTLPSGVFHVMIYNRKTKRMEFRHKEILYEWGILMKVPILKLTKPLGTKYITNPQKIDEVFNLQ